MTEKDLDIAIEKCERIMEFDTRTMQNPVSENGWIFEKVYDLLQYLRQFQFATDTNVGGNLIDRQAALDAIKKLEKPAPTAQHLSAIFDCEDTIKALPSAQPGWIPCSERLPKPEDEVLLTMDYKGRRCVELGNIWSDGTVHTYVDEYLTPDGRKYRKVVAWCELSKPWEEEKAEGAATPRGVILGIGGHPNGQKRIDGGKPL